MGNKKDCIQRYEKILNVTGARRNKAGTSKKKPKYNDDDYGSDHGSMVNTKLLFKDVEGSLSTLSGDENVPISRWLEEFNDTSKLLDWNNLQKFNCGKQLMTGTAKLLLRAKKVTCWESLVKQLNNKFQAKMNSGQVHQMLMKTKMLEDEKTRQYILRMREIGYLADIDNRVLMKYIIDGVSLNNSGKLWLSGAKDFKSLREKFGIFKNDMCKNKISNSNFTNKYVSNSFQKN